VLTIAERDLIWSHGMNIWLVWETSAARPLGGARLIDTGTANYSRSVFKSGGNIVMMSEAGAFVTNLVPWTMGNTDQELIQFQFPI